MRIVAPKPFTMKGGKRAVLLLHGFTGGTADVKQLGRYLNLRGYTCHAPLYKGHGEEPDVLIRSGPEDWWQDALDGYRFLNAEGFSDIAVAGVSLGGVLSLKLGSELPVKGIVSMCAPIQEKTVDDLYQRVRNYASMYKRLEGKNSEQIDSELKRLDQTEIPALDGLRRTIADVRGKLNGIAAPTFVMQGRLDDPLYQASAQIIYDHIGAEHKQLQYYEHSGHIITVDQERDQVYEDACRFLNSLEW
ncbi:carboxylesterase [Cohnella sp. AR92]|uniref:alpha/beta hydrolase n=1 Tax=Cohnella sp. AR92 TaxID=648716 RepID=UPI000F8C47A7|nr:alpha/beta fold hydrolase [Cohnella sp. AR92]RUS45131.1 alpha/beta fold hydrolase [Cohnella sp. AR92]